MLSDLEHKLEAVGQLGLDAWNSTKVLLGSVVALDRKVQGLEGRADELELKRDGILLWEIPHFSAKMEAAKVPGPPRLVLKSPSFYSGQYGYKVQATLYPNGKRNRDAEHVTLAVNLVPGHYDRILSWPCLATVTVKLFDQKSCGTGVQSSFHTSCNVLSSKPATVHWYKFVSHATLGTRNYLLNDTLVLKIQFEPTVSTTVVGTTTTVPTPCPINQNEHQSCDCSQYFFYCGGGPESLFRK